MKKNSSNTPLEAPDQISFEQIFLGNGKASGYSVQQTADDGYIIAGSTGDFGQPIEGYLLKANSDGLEQWSKVFVDTDRFMSVQKTIDGGYIITGVKHISNGFDVCYLLKINSEGIEQWSQEFTANSYNGNAWGQSGQQTADGGYIITGLSFVDNDAQYCFLLKTNEIGQEQWSKMFLVNNSYSNRGYSVQQTTDGGYIITGTYRVVENGILKSFLIKTNDLAVEQWSKTFEGNESASLRSVQQTTDGGFIAVGWSDGCYLLKTSSDGIEQWSQTFFGDLGGRSVQQVADGGYIVSGSKEGYLYLLKTNSDGVEQWSQMFSGNGVWTNGWSVQQTTDGGFVVVGETNDSITFGSKCVLLKTDSDGNVTFN